MPRRSVAVLVGFFVLALAAELRPTSAQEFPFRDPALPVDQRVADVGEDGGEQEGREDGAER